MLLSIGAVIPLNTIQNDLPLADVIESHNLLFPSSFPSPLVKLYS